MEICYIIFIRIISHSYIEKVFLVSLNLNLRKTIYIIYFFTKLTRFSFKSTVADIPGYQPMGPTYTMYKMAAAKHNYGFQECAAFSLAFRRIVIFNNPYNVSTIFQKKHLGENSSKWCWPTPCIIWVVRNLWFLNNTSF